MRTLKNMQHKNGYAILIVLALIVAGCSSVAVPTVQHDVSQAVLTQGEIARLTATPPKPQVLLIAENSPLPKGQLALLKTGEKNTFGIIVTQGMEGAYRAYLAGEGETALAAIGADEISAASPGLGWYLSFLKAQVLLMMGKAAEAEMELEKTSRLEIKFVGHNLNSIALRAEVKTWMEDYDGALQDLAFVIKAIGNWELPISYLSFPTNRDQLYILSTAKLRAYTVLTAINIFKENYQAAYEWGKETERLFNNVHFVTNHPLYGAGDTTHADSYYGRAMNLTFLASAALAVRQNPAEADELFQKAESFYKTLGYAVGKVTIAALKARIYNRLGKHDLCYEAGQAAMKMAIDAGLPDYVWRIGILTGKTLLAKGDPEGAEKAFRQAQASVGLISGGLATERAKIRFGVGKEDITYHLAQLDLAKRDWALLFQDMETGRARAFIDILRDRPIVQNRQTELLTKIASLEQAIRMLRLKLMAPGLHDTTLRDQMVNLHKEWDNAVRHLKQQDPELAELVSVSTTSLSEVQKGLSAGDVIAYFVPARGRDSVKFLRITANSVELEELLVPIAELTKQMDDFSLAAFDPELLENRGVVLSKKAIRAKESLKPEYAINALKKSLRVDSWGVQKNLYVVATGILHFIPWAIFDTEFPIAMLPTGAWINKQKVAQQFKQNIAIVGDPDFGGQLPQLPGARDEALTVGRFYNVSPLVGNAATENNLRTKIGKGVTVLHFATHGIYDALRPLQSAVFLSANGTAFPLTAKQLYENPLPANLVILSACETGLGKTVAGDDLLGLTRSFYLGGAQTVLSSLWEIEDEGTKQFMLTFHRAMAQHGIGKAWLEARDDVKAKGYSAAVYGAFVLNGFLP